jgi:hypothetical protein
MHPKYWFTLLVVVALVGQSPAGEPTGAQIDWVRKNAIPFKTVKAEANLPESYRVNDYVLAGEGDPQQLIGRAAKKTP